MFINTGIVTFDRCVIDQNTASKVRALARPTSIAPKDDPFPHRVSPQAGGVYIRSGTTTFTNCTINSNTASEVSARFI